MSMQYFVGNAEIESYAAQFGLLKHYFSFCIIEVEDGGSSDSLVLPQSLVGENAMFFDRILFVIYGA